MTPAPGVTELLPPPFPKRFPVAGGAGTVEVGTLGRRCWGSSTSPNQPRIPTPPAILFCVRSLRLCGRLLGAPRALALCALRADQRQGFTAIRNCFAGFVCSEDLGSQSIRLGI